MSHCGLIIYFMAQTRLQLFCQTAFLMWKPKSHIILQQSALILHHQTLSVSAQCLTIHAVKKNRLSDIVYQARQREWRLHVCLTACINTSRNLIKLKALASNFGQMWQPPSASFARVTSHNIFKHAQIHDENEMTLTNCWTDHFRHFQLVTARFLDKCTIEMFCNQHQPAQRFSNLDTPPKQCVYRAKLIPMFHSI